jgi:hypothetical protein
MSEIDRLSRDSDWIDLDIVERERTPELIIEVGIRLHLAGLSLSNTKQHLETLGVGRSRTAIHNWVKKADLQPTSGGPPNQVAVDETVIQVDDERHWLYAAVDPATNEFLHVRLFRPEPRSLPCCFYANSARNSTLTTQPFSSMPHRTSRLRSIDSDSDFTSVATDIATPSNVSSAK